MEKLKINDIAKLVGVSKTTVSFVINGKGDERNISKKTQEKVFKVINDNDYKPNYMAQNLKTGKTNTIAYLVPDFGNPFFACIGREIEKLLSKCDYQLIVSSTDENSETETKILNKLITKQVDGYIGAFSDLNTPIFRSLLEQKVPMVFFDRDDETISGNYVGVESQISMKKAVAKLIENGYKKIGLVSLLPVVKPLQERIAGYEDAHNSANIDMDINLICYVNPNNLKAETFSKIRFLMKENVDAFVFTNNQVAAEALLYLNLEFADSLPNLGIATFDNLDWFDYTNNKIISIAQPISQIARSIVKLLLKNLKNKEVVNEKVMLEPKLIIR